VGVIVHLGVFFAWRVFWPEATTAAPFSGRFDAVSVAICAVALAALVWRKVGVIPVVAAAALTGLALWALSP
jgi:chromate transporter